MALAIGKAHEFDRLTKAEHDVEKYNQQHRNCVDGKTGGTHPKGPLRNILSSSEQMRPDGESIRHRCQDDKGAHQVGECRFAA